MFGRREPLFPLQSRPRPDRGARAVRVAIGVLAFVAIYTLVIFPLVVAPRIAAPPAAAVVAAKSDAPADAGVDAGARDAAAIEVHDAGPPPWRVADLAHDDGVDVTTGTMGHRTLVAALAANGISRGDVARLLKAFAKVRDFDRVQGKDTFVVARAKATKRLVAFEYSTAPAEVWQAREEEGGALVGKKLELPVEVRPVSVGFAVADDLRTSLVRAGLDDDLLKLLDDALDGHVELADVRAGARLRVVAREERVSGAFVRYAELDAVEYVAPAAHDPLRVYRAGPREGFYDAHGKQPYHGGWRTPVPFARVSSRFNPRRMHPVLHTIIPHNGVDFAASSGTPVYATAAGVVKLAGDGGPCGNMVQVLHANGLVSAYCHLSRFAAGIHAGQHVESRQLVGYVGQTGRATGPHLHFAIKRGSGFIDPLSLKLDGVRVLPPSERDAFEAKRAELDAALDAIPLASLAGIAGIDAGMEPDGGSDDDDLLDDPIGDVDAAPPH